MGEAAVKRKISLIALGVLAVALLIVGPATSLASNPHRAGQITIQSWLLANPSTTGLAGTVTACFKLDGAFSDQGGGPTWSDATYGDKTAPAHKCADWTPVGGFNFVPPASAGGEDFTLYAVHTITGQKGQIFITFAGSYNLVSTNLGTGTWVITGGTGVYEGVQGQGTWSADATTFPYIRHTEIGTMSFR
jgi:hypothetical protein